MPDRILLITPPFTQLNTPYPATPYLKRYLKRQGYDVFQADLGIELIHKIFSPGGFRELFDAIRKKPEQLSPNSFQILQNEQHYLQTVEQVMAYLQYRDTTLSRRICGDTCLPRASRFHQLPDLDWSFGSIGVNDEARFLATLYIEDIGDLIKDAITPYFGFSRYAEKLGLSAHAFAPIAAALEQPENIIEKWLLSRLDRHIEQHRPDVVGITIPFPGNLYSGLKCGRHIKKHFPGIVVVVGGGFVSTELRELSDPAVFDHLDYLTLDDGELPFLNILRSRERKHQRRGLTRTFVRVDREVKYLDDAREKDPPSAETGWPDYSDLPLDKYLSLIEIANPMHRLWSDGRWNKLTLAHGCYWHKCSFCDISLDYISRFESVPATLVVGRIEQVMSETGQTGFHFVDEAAPPALLKELALELLRRKITISWWTNIRFEQAFTKDLCSLLAAAGCIAVTGGLEAASDRLLKLMNKGVTVEQAALACSHFVRAGIMVHAYLMYGFPTQTDQETIDSLEVVRQFFHHGLVQSAFWHEFTATVHSDVGRHPEKYSCTIRSRPVGGFAKNDLVHEDPIGCAPRDYAQGLNKAICNYMQGIGTDFPIKGWFDFPVRRVSTKKDRVEQATRKKQVSDEKRMGSRIVWHENPPMYVAGEPAKKGGQARKDRFVFYMKNGSVELVVDSETGAWLNSVFGRFGVQNQELMSLVELKASYEARFVKGFGPFLRSRTWRTLRENGLLLI